MTAADRFAAPAGRPLWLTTLADLGLLLVGFFVFLQATQHDPERLAQGFRQGFDAPAAKAPPAPAMPVERAVLDGFAAGSAALPDSDAVTAWVRTAARDARVTVRLAGATAGADDRDPATGSAQLLALDRARALAVHLVARGAVRADQISIAPAATGTRAVQLSLGFDGPRQGSAGRQPPLAAQ